MRSIQRDMEELSARFPLLVDEAHRTLLRERNPLGQWPDRVRVINRGLGGLRPEDFDLDLYIHSGAMGILRSDKPI